MLHIFSLTTHQWGLQESLAVQVLAERAPEGTAPEGTAPVGRASEGRDQGQKLGLPGGSLAGHSQPLVGTVLLGPGCSWVGACRNPAEGVRTC